MNKREYIYKLIKDPDRETLRSELKSYKLLKNNDALEKIAKQVIGFANRIGGYLIIGADNDGNLEGKGKFNFDEEKGRINNYLHDKISPIIDFNIEYFEYEDGDILVITVSPFKDIPHAIIQRKNSHIKWRQYYYRTSSGIKLMTDKQLQYMFQSKSLDFSYPFSIIVHYNNEFNINYNIDVPKSLLRGYGYIMADLPIQIKQKILDNEKNIPIFFLEITPYLVLRSIAWSFQTSWNVEIEKSNKAIYDRMVPLENYNSKRISINKLPNLDSTCYLSTLGLDLVSCLEKSSFPEFFVPAELEFLIQNDYSKKVSLTLSHPDFELKLNFHKSTGGLYLVQDEPQFAYRYDELMNLNFQEIKGDLQARFNFPETDFKTFDDFIRYSKNIKQIIKEEWSHEHFLSTQPNKAQYQALKKLDEISSKLDK